MNTHLLYILLTYLAAVNLTAFTAFGIDKWNATHRRRRISEASLLMYAAVGGSVGAWAGMKVWRHKTLHRKFRYGVPAILAAHTVLAFYLFYFI